MRFRHKSLIFRVVCVENDHLLRERFCPQRNAINSSGQKKRAINRSCSHRKNSFCLRRTAPKKTSCETKSRFVMLNAATNGRETATNGRAGLDSNTKHVDSISGSSSLQIEEKIILRITSGGGNT